jgi:hypothetical protein
MPNLIRLALSCVPRMHEKLLESEETDNRWVYALGDCSQSVFGVSAESMQCSYDHNGNSVPTILLLMQERLYHQGGLKVRFAKPHSSIGSFFSFRWEFWCNGQLWCSRQKAFSGSTQRTATMNMSETSSTRASSPWTSTYIALPASSR